MVGVLPSHTVAKIFNENMDEEVNGGKPVEPIGVGSRIRCENSTGTVKYVGEVAGYVGLWYGIDWDDAERGKHNGSVKGERYFEASSDTSGSFVRPNKISPSISCADAIRKYYGEKEVSLIGYFLVFLYCFVQKYDCDIVVLIFLVSNGNFST